MSKFRARILLSTLELARLHFAVAEAEETNTSFIRTAIQNGLTHIDSDEITSKRNGRVEAWLPIEFKQQIKNLANAHSVSQQSLLRYCLFKHIKNAPWKQITPEEAEVDGG